MKQLHHLSWILVLTILGACAKKQEEIKYYNQMIPLQVTQVSNFVETLPLFLRLSAELKKQINTNRSEDQVYGDYLRKLSQNKTFQNGILNQTLTNMEQYMLVSFNVFQALTYVYRMETNYTKVMSETYRSLLKKKEDLSELAKSVAGTPDTNVLIYRQASLENEFILYSNMLIVHDFAPLINKIGASQ